MVLSVFFEKKIFEKFFEKIFAFPGPWPGQFSPKKGPKMAQKPPKNVIWTYFWLDKSIFTFPYTLLLGFWVRRIDL